MKSRVRSEKISILDRHAMWPTVFASRGVVYPEYGTQIRFRETSPPSSQDSDDLDMEGTNAHTSGPVTRTKEWLPFVLLRDRRPSRRSTADRTLSPLQVAQPRLPIPITQLLGCEQ